MTTPKTVVRSGFKTRINTIERKLRKEKAQLARLEAQEKLCRERWVKANNEHEKLVNRYLELNTTKTKKAAHLKVKIKAWPMRSIEMTKKRDALRALMAKARETIAALETDHVMLKEKERNEAKNADEIVKQVFALNEMVVRASHDLGECLKGHVFPRLFDEDQKLCSQVSFTSADGLRRVVAIVNSMTVIDADLALKAQAQIERFFDRFRESADVDPGVKALYDLTRQILIEKVNFKVGPDLCHFLSMEIDATIFPELTEAQKLLGQSIRSEKSNSYIRIYERASTSENWTVVPQS